MRKFDSGIWQKSITVGLRRPPWLRLGGRGAKGQGRRQPLVLPLTICDLTAISRPATPAPWFGAVKVYAQIYLQAPAE